MAKVRAYSRFVAVAIVGLVASVAAAQQPVSAPQPEVEPASLQQPVNTARTGPVGTTRVMPAEPVPDAAAAAAQAVKTAPPAEGPAVAAPAEDPDWWKKIDWHALARRDKMEFLRLAQKRANEVTQFTATFSKQERIRGELRDEEVTFMKWRAEPFSVYLKYEKGDKGREVLFVKGQRDDMALVKLGGLFGFIVVDVDPHGDQAMQDNLRPITMAGLPNILNKAMPEFELARRNGDLTIQYLGRLEINGRKAYTIKRILPKKDIYPGKELVIFIDVETLVPVGADTYDWDGQLESRYRYSNIDLDPNLKDADFSRDNSNYNF